MDSEQTRYSIEYSKKAVSRLDEIWFWTADNFGVAQADRYETFIRAEIGKLAENPTIGSLKEKSTIWYFILQWTPRSHGHVVFYSFDPQSRMIFILDILHTATDWQSKV